MEMANGDPVQKRVTQTDICYWMGQVDGKLDAISSQIASLSARLGTVEERYRNLSIDCEQRKAAQAAREKNDGEAKNHITFTWLVEKAFIPLVMSFLFWFLFSILPSIVKGTP